MKRLVCLLLVAVLVSMASCSMAVTRKEYYESVKAQTETIIEQLIGMYDTSPEKFDEDYIYLAYGYWLEYRALSVLCTAESSLDLRKIDPFKAVQFGDLHRSGLKIETTMASVINDDIVKWMNGEETNENMASYLINPMRTIFDKK